MFEAIKDIFSQTVDPDKLGIASAIQGAKHYNHREMLLLNPQRDFTPRKIKFIDNADLPPTFDEFEKLKGIKKAVFNDNSLSLWCKDEDSKNGEKRHSLSRVFRGEDSRALYTDQHIQEWVQARDDVLHFAKYCTITNIDHGQIVVPLRSYQVEMLKRMDSNRNNIFMLSRQLGKSTMAALHLAHYLCFNDKPVAIVSFSKASALEIFDRTKECLEMLPDWLQPSPTKLTESEMHFAHGAKIVARQGGKNALRGDSYAKVFIDEFAHFEDIETSWNKSIRPVVSSGKRSSIIICSTPKGDNTFKTLWDGAVAGENAFKPYQGDWRINQDRMYNDETGLLDYGEHFKSNEVSTIGRIAFEQEHETSFLSSTQCIVGTEVFDNAVVNDSPEIVPVTLNNGSVFNFKEFKEPEVGHRYTLGIDPAEAVGVDSTVITVIDQSVTPVEVVATFSEQSIYPKQTAEVTATIAKYFNNGFVFVEVNQPTGGEILKYLESNERYINVYAKHGASYKGIKLVKAGRKHGCNLIKHLFEEEELIINSPELFKELMRFCFDEKKKLYRASDGHDDHVMSIMMHSIGLNDSVFHAHWMEDTSHLETYDADDRDIPIVLRSGGWGADYYSGYQDGYAPTIQDVANQFNSMMGIRG
ncbi:terminase family protein [Vibrio sp. Isolate30]|uniref:terminase large subunit domain-containing protein n=1 Tax=Vibrio sp. Isolate30 TaxID=2908536 RepID=UPI001EFC3A7E|nr:terminase family protein [Vibrio sp. Isolate30]MCG9630153.1 terminase family protein [Vibrio sp. Isolate30]